MKMIKCPYCLYTFVLPITLDNFANHLKINHDITIAKRGMIKTGSQIMPKKERENLGKLINLIKNNKKVKIKKSIIKRHKVTKMPKIRIIFSAFESGKR